MAKSPAHTISNLLSTQGLGDTAGDTTSWRITTGRQLSDPDSMITVYDTGGLPDNPAYRLNYASIQVRVRGAKDDYPGAWSKMNDIKEFLNGIDPQDLEGDRWSGIITLGGVIGMGFDASNRPELVLNFRCFIEPAADSSVYMHRESL